MHIPGLVRTSQVLKCPSCSRALDEPEYRRTICECGIAFEGDTGGLHLWRAKPDIRKVDSPPFSMWGWMSAIWNRVAYKIGIPANRSTNLPTGDTNLSAGSVLTNVLLLPGRPTPSSVDRHGPDMTP